jgi:hypothetical protein
MAKGHKKHAGATQKSHELIYPSHPWNRMDGKKDIEKRTEIELTL